MKRIVLLSLLILTAIVVKAQTTYTWNGVSGASWTTASNWLPNTGTPTTGDNVVFTNAGAMSIINVPAITINNISKSSGAGIVTLNNTVGTVFTIGGTATVSAGGLSNSGLLTFTFASGAVYDHAMAGGTIPTATWNANATCSLSNTVTAPSAGLNQTFGHLTIAEGALTPTLTGNTTVAGTLTLTSGNLALSSFTLTLNGDLANSGTGQFSGITTSNLIIGGTGALSGPLKFVSGAQNLSTLTINRTSSGTVAMAAGSNLTLNSTAATCLTLTNGDFAIGANTLTINGGITQTSGTLTGGTTSNLTITGSTGTACTIPAITNGLLNLALTKSAVTTITLGSTLTLAGGFTISASNTFAMGANNLNANGNISHAGTITASTGKIILANGTVPHNLTGTGTYINLELNDALGATMGASFAISGVFTQTAGTFSIGSNTLTLSGTLAATGSGDFGGTTASTLNISGTGNLGNTVRFNSSAQNLTALNITRTTSGVVSLGSDLTITTGTLTVNAAGLVFNHGANTITFVNNIPITLTSGTYNGGATSHMVFNGTTSFTLPVITGGTGNLTFNRNAYTLTTATTALTVNGNLVLTAGGISMGAALTVGGNLTLTAGTLTLSTFAFTLNGDITAGGTGTFVGNTATTTNMVINGSGPLSNTLKFSGSLNLGNLTINRTSAGTVALGTSLTLNSTTATSLSLTAGDFAIGAGNTLTLNGGITVGAGTLTGGTTSSLTITGSTGTGSVIPTVINGLQNLTLSKSVATTFTLTGSTAIAGTLTINASNTLTMGSFDFTVGGNMAFSGVITQSGNGKIIFANGTAAHSLTGTGTYYNVELNDAFGVTMNTSVTIGGVLTQTAGTFSIGAFTLTLNGSLAATGAGNFGGTTSSNLTIGGTGALGNTLRFASGVQNLLAFTITRSTAATVTLGSDLTVSGTLALTSATINFSIGSNKLTFANQTTPLSFTAGAVFTGGTTSDLAFTGTSSVTLPAITITNGLRDLIINRSGYVITWGSSLAIAGNLTLTAGQLGIGAFTLTINGDIAAGGAGTITGSATSNLVINGTGALSNTLNFTTGAQSLSTLTVNRTTLGNVTLGTSNNLTLNSTAAGSLTLTNGNLSIGAGNLLTLNGGISYASGTLTGGTTSSLTLTGSTAVTTTIPSVINGLQNLSLTKSAASTFTLGGNYAITGTLTINASNTLALSTFDFTAGGNIVHNGTMTAGTGKIILANGSAAHSLTGASAYINLELNDAQNANVNASFSINGVLTQTAGTLNIASGIALTMGAGSSLAATGNGDFGGTTTSTLNIAGTGALGNTLRFNAASQNLTVLNITRATSGVVNMGSDLTITTGTLTLNATGLVFNQGANTITFVNNATPISIVSGTYNGGTTSNMVFNGTGTASVPLITGGLNNLTINRTGLVVTMSNNLTINGNLTLTAGALGLGAFTYTLNGDIPAGGTGTITGATTANLIINGTGALSNTVKFTSGSQNLNTLTINRTSSGSVTLGSSLVLNAVTAGSLTLTDGTFGIGAGNLLTLNGNLAIASGTLAGGTTSSLTYAGATVFAFAVPNISGGLQNLSLTKSAAATFTFNNNLTLTGIFTVNASNTFALGTNNITVGGNVIHNGTMTATTGEIVLNGGTAAHTLTGTSTYINLELDDAFGANMGASFTVSNNLTLTNGTFAIGANTLTLTGPAIAGTPANLSTTTTSGLTLAATYLGTSLPSSIANIGTLTLNSTQHIALNSNITVATNFNKPATAGRTLLGNFDLIIGSAASFTVTTPTTGNMIVADATGGNTGQLKKIFPTGTTNSFTFPVGDITGTIDYSPVFFSTFVSTGGTSTIGVKVDDSVHPQMDNLPVQTNYVSRIWKFSESLASTAYNYTGLTLTYAATGDANGTISTANTQINLYDNTALAWTQLNSTYAVGPPPSFNAAGNYTNTTAKLGGNDFTMRLNAPQVYTWVATSGSGDWQTAANWSPARVTPAATDILQFANGGTPTATNVPTQTVSKLLVTGNTNATLQSPAAATLSINGAAAAVNLNVASGSTLQIGALATTGLVLTYATTTGQLGTIDGDLTINNFGAFTNTTGNTTTINGNFTQNTGGAITPNAGIVVSSGGDFIYNVNGGTIPSLTWNTGSTCNITSPATSPASGWTQTFSNLTINSGITISLTSACTVNGTLTLTSGTFALASQSLTLNGSAIAGTPANLSTIATSSLTLGATYTGTTLPSSIATIGTLTLNTTQNVSLASSVTVAVSFVKPATAGRTLLGNFDLIIGSTASFSITTPGIGNMIVPDATGGNIGQFKKIFASGTTSNFTFPVGDITGSIDYSPVFFSSFVSTGGTSTIGVKVDDSVHPQMDNLPVQTNYVSRIWEFSESLASTGYTYTGLTLTYAATGDANGTISSTNNQINFYDNTALIWAQLNSAYAVGPPPTFTAAGTYSNATGKLGGNDFTIRLNAPQVYTWVATSGSGDWNTATNWSPVRNTASTTDILRFANGGTPTAINVPTQTVASLTITGNTNATLQTGTTNTLSVNGTTGVSNITVNTGSTLQLGGGAAVLTLNFITTTGQLATFDGGLTLNTNGTFTPSATSSLVTIGGTLTIAGGSYNNLTSSGSTTINGTVNHNTGTYTNSTITNLNGTYNLNGGTFTQSSTFNANTGSNYNYAINGGALVTTITWNTGSTCTLSSSTTAPTSGINQTYAGLTIAMGSGVTGTPSGGVTVNGTFTGTSGTLAMGANTFTLNGNFGTVNSGTLTFSGGTLTLGSTGGNTTLPNLTGLANLNISRTVAATTTLSSNFAITNAFTNSNLNTFDINGFNFSVGGNFTNNSGAIVTANAVGSTITLNGTGVPNFQPAASGTLTGGAIYNLTINKSSVGVNMTGNVTVSNQLTLTAGTFTISGATLTLNGLPISGTSTLLAASALNASGIVIGGSAAGHFLPSSLSANFFGFLTVNNPYGVTLNGNIALNAPTSALTLTNGNVVLNGFNLTLNGSNAGALSGGSSSSYVVVDGTNNGAQFIRTVFSTGNYAFPIGTAANYAPTSLNFTTNGISRNIGARFIPSAHPSINSPTAADTYTDCYWRFTTSNNTNLYTYSATFSYAGFSVLGGAESTLKVSRHNGTTWNEDGGATVNTSTDLLTTSTGLTQAAWDLNTVDFAGRVGPMVYVSSTTVQQTGSVAPASTNQAIIQVQVVTSGSGTPLNLNSLTFNTNGSTSAADIASARVYYTGTSATFATGTPYGSVVTSPSGSNTVTGSQALISGTNYFWVAYNIAASPTIGNVVDAECTNINLSSTNYTPSVTAPAGSRPIAISYCTPTEAITILGTPITACYPGQSYGTANLTITGTPSTVMYNNSSCFNQTVINATSVASVTQGANYTVSVTRVASPNYNSRLRVYVDWNNDGDMTDSDELIAGPVFNAISNVAFTVPLTAAVGTHAVWVWNSYDPGAPPCQVSQGQFLIGSFNVLLAPPVAYAVTGTNNCTTATIGVANFQTGVSYQLKLNGNDIGAPITTGTVGSPISFGVQTGIGTYTVVGTNLAGSTSMTGSITIFGNPAAPTITPSASTAICAGSSIDLTSSYATGNVWSTTETIQTISVNTADDFTVTYTDSNGCSATSTTTTTTIVPLVGTPIFTAGVATLCEGSTTTYTATAANSSSITYSIVGGIGASINPTSGIVSSVTGNFTVRATATGTCGGPTTADFAVTVNPLPSTVVATAGTGATTSQITANWNAAANATSYILQVSTVSNFASTILNTNVGNVTTYTIGSLSNNTTYYYRVTAVNACGNSLAVSNVITYATLPPVTGPLTWDGSTSTDWNDATNWTPQNIPTALDDVIIPNVTNDPEILALATNGVCKDITIAAGATITISASNKTIDVKGNWSGTTTTIVSGPGKTIFSGTAGAQTITGGGTFSTLRIDNANGATIASGGNVVKVTTALELKAGTLTTNGNLQTISTSTGTAYINDFSSGFTGSLSGLVSVERFIPPSPNGFRYIGQPVNTGTGIMDISAMQGFTVTGTPGQTIPLPTCSPTFTPLNVAQNSPYGNLMYFKENGPYGSPACRQRGWWFQTTGSLTVGRGYGIKQGGNTKITYRGTANTGTITSTATSTHTSVFTPAGNNGWNLVSNPYPSAITIDEMGGNPNPLNDMPAGYDKQIQFYITGNSTLTGSYQTYNVAINGAADIALGQGFWVRVTTPGTTPAWTLGQGHRTTQSPTYFDVNPQIESHLKVNVSGNGFADLSNIYFVNGADAGLDIYDGNKWNSATGQPTLYTKAGEEVMGINSLPSLSETMVVPMGLNPGANGNFTFTFEDIASFPQTSMIYLEDLKLGTMNNLRDNTTYEFNANLNDSPDRFMLHFQPGLQAEVADQDCDSEGSIELTQPAPTVWSTYEVKGNDNNVYATGTNLTGTVTVNNLPAQEYVVTVTHPSGYSAQEYITVNGSNPISASINASSTLVMVDEMVTLTANATNANEYVWNFGDGSTQTGSANVVHAYDAEGTYNVILTASNSDCNSEATKIIKVNNTATGLNGTAATNLNIYGQGERVVIEFNKWGGDKADIFMYNTLGQRMESLTGVSTLKGRQELYIADIKPGYYFIQVVSNGEVLGKKVFLGKQ